MQGYLARLSLFRLNRLARGKSSHPLAYRNGYRALGFHMMKGVLTGEVPFTVRPRPNETRSEACKRIIEVILAALEGIPVPRNAVAAPQETVGTGRLTDG
jgi:hypothetical protein